MCADEKGKTTPLCPACSPNKTRKFDGSAREMGAPRGRVLLAVDAGCLLSVYIGVDIGESERGERLMFISLPAFSTPTL